MLQLTRQWKRNSCAAGYKEIWSKQDGFPSRSFLKALHENLECFVEEKIASPIVPIGSLAGKLPTGTMGEQLGLTESTAVVVSTIDAHASVLGAGMGVEIK